MHPAAFGQRIGEDPAGDPGLPVRRVLAAERVPRGAGAGAGGLLLQDGDHVDRGAARQGHGGVQDCLTRAAGLHGGGGTGGGVGMTRTHDQYFIIFAILSAGISLRHNLEYLVVVDAYLVAVDAQVLLHLGSPRLEQTGLQPEVAEQLQLLGLDPQLRSPEYQEVVVVGHQGLLVPHLLLRQIGHVGAEGEEEALAAHVGLAPLQGPPAVPPYLVPVLQLHHQEQVLLLVDVPVEVGGVEWVEPEKQPGRHPAAPSVLLPHLRKQPLLLPQVGHQPRTCKLSAKFDEAFHFVPEILGRLLERRLFQQRQIGHLHELALHPSLVPPELVQQTCV